MKNLRSRHAFMGEGLYLLQCPFCKSCYPYFYIFKHNTVRHIMIDERPQTFSKAETLHFLKNLNQSLLLKYVDLKKQFTKVNVPTTEIIIRLKVPFPIKQKWKIEFDETLKQQVINSLLLDENQQSRFDLSIYLSNIF